jgi:hypothetical protein
MPLIEASGVLASFAALSPRIKGVSMTGTISGAAGAITDWGKAMSKELIGAVLPTASPGENSNEEEGGHFEGAAVIIENRFSRFSTHFEVLGLSVSLEKDESESDEDDSWTEELSMELASFSPGKSEIEEYRILLREYYQKDIENSMISWKRNNKSASYQDYLVDTVPENIKLDAEGKCIWMDPRTERLKRTFDRVQPSHSLHVLGRPPQPDAEDETDAPGNNTFRDEIDDLFD